MALDLAYRHAAGIIHRDDLVVQAIEPRLALGHGAVEPTTKLSLIA